jgi:hypothetical protein
MIRGSNVIVGHCPITSKKITQADVNIGLAEEFDGQLYFINHLPRGRELLQDDKIIGAIQEVEDKIVNKISKEQKYMDGKELLAALHTAADSRGIPPGDMEYAYKAFVCLRRDLD